LKARGVKKKGTVNCYGKKKKFETGINLGTRTART